MKKILIATITFLLVMTGSMALLAQPGGGPGGPGGMRMTPEQETKLLEDSLNLNAEQLVKVKALNEEYAQKMQSARANAGEDWSAMRETMMAMRQEKDQKLKAILTADQFTHWQTMRQRMNQGRGTPGTPPANKPEKPKKEKGKKGGN
ncbi:MAG: hypothetical protein H6555_11695 [Lewinellaceae bacterium]|nr:hypothetical protein [Lewinellaceae bacterium]